MNIVTFSSSNTLRQESTIENIRTANESLTTTSNSILQPLTTEMVLMKSTSSNSISQESTRKVFSSSSLNSILEESTMKISTTDSRSSLSSSNSIQQESMLTSETLSRMTSTKMSTLHQSIDLKNRIKYLKKNFCSDCSPAKIELISKQSNSVLIEYKFNENIFISSSIEFNCRELFSIKFQWIISNSTILNLNNENIRTTLNEIYIPSKILTIGIYEFKLMMIVNSSSSIFTSFQSILIKIIQSKKLIVSLIEFQTSKITLGINQQLLIEPGKYSFHDDGTQFIENVCRKRIDSFQFIFIYFSIGMEFGILLSNL